MQVEASDDSGYCWCRGLVLVSLVKRDQLIVVQLTPTQASWIGDVTSVMEPFVDSAKAASEYSIRAVLGDVEDPAFEFRRFLSRIHQDNKTLDCGEAPQKDARASHDEAIERKWWDIGQRKKKGCHRVPFLMNELKTMDLYCDGLWRTA
jgi:hypothetical protein